MTEHTRFARFKTRVSKARTASRERRETRATQRFERQTQRLEREGEIEERRAKVRKFKAVARPRGAPTGGFGQRFIQAQQSFFPPPRGVIRRKKPRKAARGKVFFDQFGRPIAIRNAPAIRRARKRRRQPQQQSPFEPTFRL